MLNEELDSTENIIGSIWGRIELPENASAYSRLHEPIQNDLTIEVIRKFSKITRYQERENQTLNEDYLEILTDEGRSEIWQLDSFVITHYRLPGR